MKTKKGNNKQREKNQIGEKRGFYQPVANMKNKQRI